MTHILIFIGLGLLPSILWLLYYLRKDVHPESNLMVLVFFLFGMVIAIPIAFIENPLTDLFQKFSSQGFLNTFLYFFFCIALIEEVGKYLAFRLGILRNPEFDEPTDALIYMIIIALGFVSVENILLLFSSNFHLYLKGALVITFSRFLTATIVHALASANIGYFFALALYKTTSRKVLIFYGLIMSTTLHALYDSATKIEGLGAPLIIGIIVLGLFFLVLWEFSNIRKLKSVCEIK